MPLSTLAKLRPAHSYRESSYDRTGGNRDFITFQPGETKTIAHLSGPGCIRHIWMTIGGEEWALGRRVVLRFFWDDEPAPSVEVPLTDFFGMGYGMFKEFTSAPLQMSPSNGRAMNCWWPMPFAKSARIEVTNEGGEERPLYFYIDYERYERLEDDLAYFHAQWRRENPTTGWLDRSAREEFVADIWKVWQSPRALNLDGAENYVLLEAEGRGHYVGCNLHIDVFEPQVNDWYGEGDDMIFIDGEPLPRLNGTGTEDYFCTAYCPKTEFSAPNHGVILYSGTPEWPWGGKNSVYRYHIEDPIHFHESIRVTIEHGHGNKLSNDYSSTAYWYQTEPHKTFPALPGMESRLPRR
jgi:Protein of unknown function (DUF2961).